jgi:hypothetical protein
MKQLFTLSVIVAIICNLQSCSKDDGELDSNNSNKYDSNCLYGPDEICENLWYSTDTGNIASVGYTQKAGKFSIIRFGNYVEMQRYVTGTTEPAKGTYKAYKYQLVNNLWNVDVHPNVPNENAFQKIFAFGEEKSEDPFPLGWFFAWKEHRGVVSFPAIIYGHRPWSNHSTDSTILIEKIQNLDNLSVDLDLKIKSVDNDDSSLNGEESLAYNLGVEVWLYDKDVHHYGHIPKDIVNKVHEFHIWIRRNKMHPAGSQVATDIEIDGLGNDGKNEYYTLYHGNGPTGMGNYTVFYLKTEQGAHRKDYYHENPTILNENINIKPFLDYALENGYFNYDNGIVTDYVGSIEVGTELMRGEGSVTFNNFNVNISKKQ